MNNDSQTAVCSIGIRTSLDAGKASSCWTRWSKFKFEFNVWFGVRDSTVLGPHIIPGSLTGTRHLSFFQNEFQGILDELNLEIRAII